MPIHYQKEGPVARIVLDNPPVNVFTPDLHKRFFTILRDFLADEQLRVAVWTAVGDRAFCAGDDIKTPRPNLSDAELIERELGPRHEDEPLTYPGWEREVLALPRYKPIIAAVNGHCLGQGFIYLMRLSDIRIASDKATFGCPEIAYGMGGAGGMMRLARMIPHSAAMWMLLTGEKLDAQRARESFIVNEVVSAERLLARADELAALIASHPPLAVRTEMEAYYRGSDMTDADAQAFTRHLYRLQRTALDNGLPLAEKEDGND